MRPIRVLLVTTWGTACGIAEHSASLKEAVEAADRSITITPDPHALHPSAVTIAPDQPDIIHLNYHGALHSRWTAETITQFRTHGFRVIVTYHDTGVPNSDQAKTVCAAADAFVVHEPYTDLEGNGYYWRMGVPAARGDRRSWFFDSGHFRDYSDQPVLGSIGFPFPWKNFDLLATITAELGWALVLIAPTASAGWVEGIRAINPHSLIVTEFLPRAEAQNLLHACDATAFPYVCHNTGQSGAILQGIAARKPVIAFETCRQFRALRMDALGQVTITWAETVDDLKREIRYVTPARIDPPIVALAEQESWTRLGQWYADLYRSLVSE